MGQIPRSTERISSFDYEPDTVHHMWLSMSPEFHVFNRIKFCCVGVYANPHFVVKFFVPQPQFGHLLPVKPCAVFLAGGMKNGQVKRKKAKLGYKKS